MKNAKAISVMIGLRYHAMLVLTWDCCLIHGGRHFKGISGKDVNSGFYICIRDRDNKQSWFQLSSTNIPRFGHTMVLFNETIYLVGGFSSDKADQAECNIDIVS